MSEIIICGLLQIKFLNFNQVLYTQNKMSQKRQNWTSQQDQIMISLIKKYGSKKWSLISEKMRERFPFEGRTGKQCRQRWHNHLCPKINKEPWTQQELKLIFDLHRRYGNKWTQIAKLLQGRTDNAVKNQYYSSLRKGLRRMCKIVGTENSTSKIKKIKPNVLSKFITNFTEFNFVQEEGQSQFYDLLFQLSNDQKFQEMKQNLVNNEMREKMEYILQKILDSKNLSKLSKEAQDPKRRSKKNHNKKEINCLKNKKQENQVVLRQVQNENQFQFNINIESSDDSNGSIKSEINKNEQLQDQKILEKDIKNQQQMNQEQINFKKQSSIISEGQHFQNLNQLKEQMQLQQSLNDDEAEALNNSKFYLSFFSKSPCFTEKSYFQSQNDCIFSNLNRIHNQDVQKTYFDIISDVQRKSISQ